MRSDELTGEERATKLIEELLVQFGLYKNPSDHSIVDRALAQVALCRTRNSSYPITRSLEEHLREMGYLPYPRSDGH